LLSLESFIGAACSILILCHSLHSFLKGRHRASSHSVLHLSNHAHPHFFRGDVSHAKKRICDPSRPLAPRA
jgi:hypothetical protein